MGSIAPLLFLLLATLLPLIAYGQTCVEPKVQDTASTCCLPSDIDCAGICFGDQADDICGVCSGDESSCCSCPRGKDYYATHHCDALVPSRAVNWPAPFEKTCTVPLVDGCSGDAYGAALLGLDPSATNAYTELLQEYVVGQINKKATGHIMCTATSGPGGENLDVVLNNAKAYIAANCGTADIGTTYEYYDQVRQTTYLLRGYNDGYYFTGPLCNRDGTQDIERGGERLGVDETCIGGCTLNARFYYDINCESGGTIGQSGCSNGNWPAGISETQTICGEETYLSVLLGSGTVYLDVASAYVTAQLNRAHSNSCATSEVLQAIENASTLLADSCRCTPGQVGCTHDILVADSGDSLAVLNKYNDGTFGPGTCGVVSASTAEDTPLSTCCPYGCTHGAGHWALYSCNLPVPGGVSSAPAARVAWPGGENTDCHVEPNAEDDSICGEGVYSILSRSLVSKNDAWTNLAGQYVAATLNVANGACTDFSGALTTSHLTTFEALLVSALAELEDNCASANGTPVASALGTSMYIKELLFEAFNGGDLGPGSCSPNDNSLCNENYASLPLVSSRCYVSDGQEAKDSCVFSGEHWKRNNYYEASPRDVLWPLFHKVHKCDPHTHACVPSSSADDAIGDAIAQALRVDPNSLGHFANGESLLQETASWCPDFMGHNDYKVNSRGADTAMLSLLQSADGSLAHGQQKWANAMNSLTTALLNVRKIAQSANDVDTIFGLMTGSGGASATPVLKALFVDNCLLQACKESPESSIPSFPDHIASCVAGYQTFTSAMDHFSNGRLEEHPHCSFSEPPQSCGSSPSGNACGCTYSSDYYTTYHTNMKELENEENLEWPKIDTDLYPSAHVPPTQAPAPLYTEDFVSLVCAGDGTWLNILRRSTIPSASTDAYLTVMKTVITAWLNAFSSGCVPADTLVVLQHATDYLGKRLDTGLCVKSGHLPVDVHTLDGRVMLAYASAIAPYAEDSTHHCENKCKTNCGDHGACSPVDGECYCENGWEGEICNTRDCHGHGIDDGTGTCHCFGGYSGTTCDSCGAPVALSGRSYICRPCPPSICGFANGVQGIAMKDTVSEDAVVFLLGVVPSDQLETYILGNTKFPRSDGLPLPVRPGSNGLTCNCKYEEEANLRTSTYGSLVSSRTVTRNSGYNKNQRASGNAYYDSKYRRSPGASEITARHQAVQDKRERRAARHETNITNEYYEDALDAIDELYYQQTMGEEMCEIYSEYVECEGPLLTRKDVQEKGNGHQGNGHNNNKENVDQDHDRITAFGIAIITIVSVILFGLVILAVVVLLMWVGVSPRANPFESRYRKRSKKGPLVARSDIRAKGGARRRQV